MKRLGTINSKYLFKTIENLFFVDITIYNAIKNRINSKNKSKNGKSKNNQKSKKTNKRYPVIRSRHALLFNSIIMVSYVITSGMVIVLTLLGKLTLMIYRFIKRKVKDFNNTICKENTVNTSNQDVNIDDLNVIDLQPILEAKKSEKSKKALPQ